MGNKDWEQKNLTLFEPDGRGKSRISNRGAVFTSFNVLCKPSNDCMGPTVNAILVQSHIHSHTQNNVLAGTSTVHTLLQLTSKMNHPAWECWKTS